MTSTTVKLDLSSEQPATAQQRGRVPRVARVLALAYRIDRAIEGGEYRDRADAARVLRLTRARVTQIMSLLLLAPGIQEAIVSMGPVFEGRDPISERRVRPVALEPSWVRQRELWKELTDE